MVDISILIPAKNEALNIRSCLDGVFSQSTPAPFEVVLVDSGSTDGTQEIAGSYPVRVYSIAPEAFHHARTRNYLAGLARGKYLVFLNADAFPASQRWLSSLINNFADSSVGAVYGRQLPKKDCNLERQMVLSTMYGDSKIVKEPSLRKVLGYRYYHFSTVSAALRRRVWESYHFPENLKIYEDVGIAKAILDAGWKIVYDPASTVYHSDNHTPVALFKRYFDIGVVWKKLEIWDDMIHTSLIHDGYKILRSKLAERTPQKAKRAKLKSIVEDSAKYAGLMLGKHEQLMPFRLKRRLSGAKLFD